MRRPRQSIMAALTGLGAAAALTAPAHAAPDDHGAPAAGGDEAAAAVDLATAVQEASPARRHGGPGEGMASVFDDDWINIGVGAGLIPTYAGSNDYFVFPLPLVTGRLAGVGFRPSGAGMNFDLLSPQPSILQPSNAPQFSLGPSFRVRVERSVNSRDPVVEAAGRLETALELGLVAGVTLPGVLHPNDSLTIVAAIRRDVLGAHAGQVIEPTVAYLTPLGLGVLVQWSTALEIVDDRFARYYQGVTQAQSIASGLPVFTARGGANRLGTAVTLAADLDGNALNGGFNIFALGGYARMLGDGAATPFTRLRGRPDQFQLGLGLGYTF